MSQSNLTPASTSALMQLINGFMASRAVYVAAELALPDRLREGAKTADTLAGETQTDARSLRRLLRALASLGVVEEMQGDRFALTSLGAALRSDVPDTLRNFALFSGSDRVWRGWGALSHSVRTGQSAMAHLDGVDSFDYFAAHPQEAKVFNQAMEDVTRQVARDLVAAYGFTRFGTIVDVGGGNGALLASILAATPTLKGILFDLPSGNAEALDVITAAGVVQRCTVVAGDFFRSVPEGADAYILKSVIHDWNDEKAIAILKVCRKAMATQSTLFLIEHVMPKRMEVSPRAQRMALRDLHMLVGPGGRERSEAEFDRLFALAGFARVSTSPLGTEGSFSLIEARPI
jgi:O-methyltransferase/methyltransferase family protein